MKIVKSIEEILTAVALVNTITEIVQKLILKFIFIGRFTKTSFQNGMVKDK